MYNFLRFCIRYKELIYNNIHRILTYPFGMMMVGRAWSAGNSHRYGFNGKEQDPGTYGDGNIYDYGFRVYDPRLGRFLSVDPLTRSYPWYTPYLFSGNKVITSIDLDGLEEMDFRDWLNYFIFGPAGSPGKSTTSAEELNKRVNSTKPAHQAVQEFNSFISNPGDYIVNERCDACFSFNPRMKQFVSGALNMTIGLGVTSASMTSAVEGNIAGAVGTMYGLTQISIGMTQVIGSFFEDGETKSFKANGPIGIVGEELTEKTGNTMYIEIGMLSDGLVGIITTNAQGSTALVGSAQDLMKALEGGASSYQAFEKTMVVASDVQNVRASMNGIKEVLTIEISGSQDGK